MVGWEDLQKLLDNLSFVMLGFVGIVDGSCGEFPKNRVPFWYQYIFGAVM